MITRAEQRRKTTALTRPLLALLIVLALWLFRPGLPSLPRSLSAPLTIETIEGLAIWFLWLLGALLALALLGRTKSTARPSLIPTPQSRVRPSRWPRPRAMRTQPPSLVIASPVEAPHETSSGRVAAPEEESVEVDAARAGPVLAQPTRPRVSVLGPLTITGARRTRRGLRVRALEVIAYLALHPRPVERDELLEAFWPGEDPRRTRLRLRQAVRDARRLLGDAIVGENEQYWLDRGLVDVDVDELERLLANTTEPDHAQTLIGRALRLFRGEPLAGSDYAWSESEVPRLRATFVDLLEKVARQHLDAGEARSALELAERGLGVDALNESLWRLAMEAESALGLREAVAERYERLGALLDERLGLEPAQETRHLHLRLLAQS
jgi:DNA-binding SARP family transcriptional activator